MTGPESLLDNLKEIYATVTTLSLATVDEQGSPHAANVYYAADDRYDLFYVSDPQSAHSRHVEQQPRVAVTIYPQVRMWQQIRGIQLHGLATPIASEEWDRVWAVFLDKFPYMADVEQMVRDQQFYRIRPTWVRWIDNSVKFGFKVETTWPPKGFPSLARPI